MDLKQTIANSLKINKEYGAGVYKSPDGILEVTYLPDEKVGYIDIKNPQKLKFAELTQKAKAYIANLPEGKWEFNPDTAQKGRIYRDRIFKGVGTITSNPDMPNNALIFDNRTTMATTFKPDADGFYNIKSSDLPSFKKWAFNRVKNQEYSTRGLGLNKVKLDGVPKTFRYHGTTPSTKSDINKWSFDDKTRIKTISSNRSKLNQRFFPGQEAAGKAKEAQIKFVKDLGSLLGIKHQDEHLTKIGASDNPNVSSYFQTEGSGTFPRDPTNREVSHLYNLKNTIEKVNETKLKNRFVVKLNERTGFPQIIERSIYNPLDSAADQGVQIENVGELQRLVNYADNVPKESTKGMAQLPNGNKVTAWFSDFIQDKGKAVGKNALKIGAVAGTTVGMSLMNPNSARALGSMSSDGITKKNLKQLGLGIGTDLAQTAALGGVYQRLGLSNPYLAAPAMLYGGYQAVNAFSKGRTGGLDTHDVSKLNKQKHDLMIKQGDLTKWDLRRNARRGDTSANYTIDELRKRAPEYLQQKKADKTNRMKLTIN